MPINDHPGPDEPSHPRPRPDHTAPLPRRLDPARPPAAERPSIRMAMAASLLRQGRDPSRVAQLTETPLALIELLAEHPSSSHRPSDVHDRPTSRADQSAPSPEPSLWRHLQPSRPWLTPRTPAPARGWWPVTAMLPMLTNLVVALTAAASHQSGLAAASLLAIVPLFAVTVLLARR